MKDIKLDPDNINSLYQQGVVDERRRIIELIDQMKDQGYQPSILIMVRERIKSTAVTSTEQHRL